MVKHAKSIPSRGKKIAEFHVTFGLITLEQEAFFVFSFE